MNGLRRWGRGLFLFALSLLPAGIMLAYRFPPGKRPKGYTGTGFPRRPSSVRSWSWQALSSRIPGSGTFTCSFPAVLSA